MWKADTSFVDVNPLGATKGKGVEIAASYLGIPMSEVLCIGDNENDREMIEAAGIGVAMGNAGDNVKASADDICGTAADDGIFTYCREHGLI